MMTVFLILIVLVIAGAVTFFLMKKGKIEDKNGNNIPDVIDTKIEEVKETVKEVKVKVKRVKEEASDVIKSVKKVGNQVKDVTSAVKGDNRKGRKPKQN